MVKSKKGKPIKKADSSKSKEQLITKAPTRFPFWGIAAPVVIIVVVGLIWASFAVFSNSDDKSGSKKEATTPTTVTPHNSEEANPRPTGKVDDHRKKISKQATNFLNEAMVISKTPSYDALMEEVLKGNNSKLPKAFIKKFRFVDGVAEQKEIKASGLAAIIQLGHTIDQGLAGRPLSLLHEDAWQYIYVDMTAGHAFVPLTLYLGSKAAFSLEYVWVDGEWIFTPYSLIDEISSANIAVQGASDITPKDAK